MNPTRTLTRPGDLLAQLAHPPSQIARADNPRADAEKAPPPILHPAPTFI